MAQNRIITEVETTTVFNPDGTEEQTIVEKTKNVQRSEEPDYVKIYTRMWCEFNQIPPAYRELFFQLAIRMTYCDATDIGHSQLVNTGKPWGDAIMSALGWKRSMYQRGLRALCECNAIHQLSRGVYQINPQYAGKGEWKFNPRLARGGIEDLVATFNFVRGTVETKIHWADDGRAPGTSPLTDTYREGLGVTPRDGAVLKSRTVTPASSEPDEYHQMAITEYPDAMPDEGYPWGVENDA